MSGYATNNRDERPAPETPQYSGAFDHQPQRHFDRPNPFASEPQPLPPTQFVFAKLSSLHLVPWTT